MTGAVLRIAMWSGPRNISTAMMRSFGNRTDTVAVDEPFYASYLAATGLDHPMREAILQAGETDPGKVAASLVEAPLPAGIAIHYQKHMTQHMLAGFPLDWIDKVTSAFLIRPPEAVLASYVLKRDSVSLADLGYEQQVRIFDRVADRLGAAPPVIEGRDVLADPRGTLAALCAALRIDFRDEMLDWPRGPRPEDGVWAPHWYEGVWASTGFGAAPAQSAPARLPDRLRPIAEAAQPFYEALLRHKLGAGVSP